VHIRRRLPGDFDRRSPPGVDHPSDPASRISRRHRLALTVDPRARVRSPSMPSEHLRDKTIVVTGVTGQVAEPVAIALAKENEVVGAARFRDEAARRRLEEAGVRCPPIDLITGDVATLPADADYVMNF